MTWLRYMDPMARVELALAMAQANLYTQGLNRPV